MEFTKTAKLRLSALVLVCICVLGARFLWGTPEFARRVITYLGYYLTAVCVGVAVFALWRVIHKDLLSRAGLTRFVRMHRYALLAIVAATALTHLHDRHAFKVTQDEYALLSTSKMMHEYREATLLGYSHYVNGQNADARVVGKRSVFFQFLLSALHDLTGYRPQNAFILNGLVTVVFYASLFALVYLLTSRKSLAYLAILLALSVPLVSHVATSAGYDLLSITMIMLSTIVLFRLVHSEGERSGHLQTLLIYTTLLAAQVRYESLLYLLPMALVILIHWLQQKRIQIGWLDAVSPAFLFLPLMLNLNMQSNSILMSMHMLDEGETFWALSYLEDNIVDALTYYFVPANWSTNSVFVSLFGLLGIVVVIILFLTRLKRFLCEKADVSIFVTGIMILGVSVCFSVMILHFWGQLTDYQATRFALPLYVVGIIAFTVMIANGDFFMRHLKWLMLFVVCVPLPLSLSSAGRSYVTESMLPGRVMEWYLSFAETVEADDVLYITHGVCAMSSFGHASFPNSALEVDPSSILRMRANGLYREVYALEVVGYDPATNRYVGSVNRSKLPKQHIVEVVEELSFRPLHIARIVKVVGYQLDDGRVIDFDAFELPERQFESKSEYSQYLFSLYPDGLARDIDLEEMGLSLSEEAEDVVE